MGKRKKNAEEALADVYEGIDFARFYALDAIRSEKEEEELTKRGGRLEGWQTKANGVSAVISPWNFPFAIPVGQILSALAAGNGVIFKPAEDSPIVGYEIIKLLKEAGLPEGVLNFLPGIGDVAGNALVMHPDVDEILFTGSAEKGLLIKEKAANVDRGDRPPKHVIAEMGGNNAIIVDDSTDIEQAIKIIFASAFGFSSQKCSACNRVIILEGLYDQFCARLEEAAKALIDVMDDPRKLGTFFGPLINDKARQKMAVFVKMARDENLKILAEAKSDKTDIEFKIYYDVDPNSPFAQQEQFFPTLSLIKADTFENAVNILNATPYALTAGVISQIPAHIEYARERIKAGNLTINGKITSAMVGQQSFGGSGLSGFSDFYSKAGGMGHVWYHRRWVKNDKGSVSSDTEDGRESLKKAEKKNDPSFPKPDDADVRAIAGKILKFDIEVFMPQSQFPGDSLARFKQGLGRVFKDRLRIYDDFTNLAGMIKNPKKSIVMTVNLVDTQIAALEHVANENNLELKDVRFMNFQSNNILDLVKKGLHDIYIKDVLSKLLVARAISEDDAHDPGSPHYRMLAHLLEGHLQKDAIDAYICRMVNDLMNPIEKLISLLKDILKAVPIEAYDTERVKPAVEVLWAA